jgi:hypothetical protein
MSWPTRPTRSEPKTGRNRLHFDLPTKSAAFKEDLVKRILGLGATPADIGQGDVPWEVLADPEGNEFCVLDPRPGIYFDTGPIAAVVANSADPEAVAPVWAEATGWRRSKSASHDGLVAMRAPHVPGPFVELLRVAGAELGGCRIRLDVAPTLEDDRCRGRGVPRADSPLIWHRDVGAAADLRRGLGGAHAIRQVRRRVDRARCDDQAAVRPRFRGQLRARAHRGGGDRVA